MRRLVVVLAAAAMVVVSTGCEPKMTITAGNGNGNYTCGLVMYVTGKVTPKDATTKVVLQRPSGGKWVDVVAKRDQFDFDPPSVRSANVSKNNGGYSISYHTEFFGKRRFRVRSNLGTAVSPEFVVNNTNYDGGYCYG